MADSDGDTIHIDDIEDAFEDDEETDFEFIFFYSENRQYLNRYTYYYDEFNEVLSVNQNNEEPKEIIINDSDFALFLGESVVFQKNFIYNYFCECEN